MSYIFGDEMIFACTLISCKAGKYNQVVSELKNLDGVKKGFGVHGRWDAVVEIEVMDLKALGDLALKINGLEGIKASETLIGFEED